MKITPLDIQHVEFQSKLRGYNREEVDRFLEGVAQTMDVLTRENAELKQKAAGLEGQLAELKKSEATLTSTLLSAQVMTDNMKQGAQREADLIVKQAEFRASELMRDAKGELGTMQRELMDIRRQRMFAIEKFRSTLRTFERMLEVEEVAEDLPMPGVRSHTGFSRESGA
jgi:cell division initiation protein